MNRKMFTIIFGSMIIAGATGTRAKDMAPARAETEAARRASIDPAKAAAVVPVAPPVLAASAVRVTAPALIVPGRLVEAVPVAPVPGLAAVALPALPPGPTGVVIAPPIVEPIYPYGYGYYRYGDVAPVVGIRPYYCGGGVVRRPIDPVVRRVEGRHADAAVRDHDKGHAGARR